MVVTRRTPVVPPPQPLVRNHSSQGPKLHARTSLSKDTPSVSRDAGPSTAAASLSDPTSGRDSRSSLDNNSGKKSRKPRRHTKNKYQKSNFQAFLDFLTKLLLLAFTIYTFSVCSQDTHLQSPVCRGLTEYKRIVLDPYIVPPIQAVLAHPSVAPYVEIARPYAHRAVEITTPFVLRTQQQWNLHVVPQWEKRIVPEWNKRVIPHWDEHVAPQIKLVQSKLEPYRLRVTREYEQRVAPRMQVAVYRLQRWQRQAKPYVLLAVSKANDGYYAAKPFAVQATKQFGHLLQQFALFLREQCQKFVYPHIATIWEQVKELSRGRQVKHGSSSSDSPFSILETPGRETAVESIQSPISAYTAPGETDVAHSPPSLSSIETVEVVHSTLAEPNFTPTPEPAIFAQPAGKFTAVESLLSAEPVLAETIHEFEAPPSDVSALVEEPDATTSSVFVAANRVPPVADKPIQSSASVTQSKIAVPAASATVPPPKSRADDEIDFDAFYAELGLEEPLGSPGGTEEDKSGLSSTPTETEDERAERVRLEAEEIARKRADVETRQAKWEAELEAQMERSTSKLQARLSDLRAIAAAELASSIEVRKSIEDLVGEAEKYLKGAEIYLKNLKGENRRSDEKQALWDRVADRVNDKFNERLSSTEGVVNAWYRLVLDKELQEVATVTAAVREIAEKGQLDLGLDYAWLEDVTFNDWQRYHALVGTSERYAQEAASMQNGTHPKIAVSNPMGPILEDLESEVQDVVIGFETRLRRIKRDGERAFNNNGSGVSQKEEEKGSAVEPEGETEPEFSILPVPRDGAGEKDQEFVPPLVIGRSQEEVLDALGKVESAGEAERVVSGTSVDPEEAVSRLAREVEGGAGMHHTEL